MFNDKFKSGEFPNHKSENKNVNENEYKDSSKFDNFTLYKQGL
jgi:hypothetical protein